MAGSRPMYTVCPRSSDPFCVLTYYIKCVTIPLGQTVVVNSEQFISANYLQIIRSPKW